MTATCRYLLATDIPADGRPGRVKGDTVGTSPQTDGSADGPSRPGGDGAAGLGLAGLVLVLLSPLGMLVAAVWYLLAFVVARWSVWVLTAVAAGYTAVFVAAGGTHPGFVHDYLLPWREVLAAVHHPGGSLVGLAAHRWPAWLAAQLFPSIGVGLVFAAGVAAWRWRDRDRLGLPDRNTNPVQAVRGMWTRWAIATDRFGPRNGVTVGVKPNGGRLVQTDAAGQAHTLCVGGAGSGKTTTMLIGMRDVIRRGHGLVVVDLKGSTDVPDQVAVWADRYGRRFLHWSITDRADGYTGPADGPAYYDPLGRGDPSRRKDLFIGAQKWDVEYYKSVIGHYVQTAFAVAARSPNPNPAASTMDDLADLLQPATLLGRAARMIPAEVWAAGGVAGGRGDEWGTTRQPGNIAAVLDRITDPELRSLFDTLTRTVAGITRSDQESSAIRNAATRLQTLTGSTAGAWLRRDPTGQRDIDLRLAADHGWVVVFSLDSSNYEETTAQIAGLIIQDLKTLSSELRRRGAGAPLHVYVDEFSAIGSANIQGLLARARDAGMPVTVATQALADLQREEPAFVGQVLGTVSGFFIHRANTESDAEILAGLTGRDPGQVVDRETRRVGPSQIQDLVAGELVYVAKGGSPGKAGQRLGTKVHYPIRVVQENPLAATRRPPVPTPRRSDPGRVPTPPPVPLPAGPVDRPGPELELTDPGPFRSPTPSPPVSSRIAPWLTSPPGVDELGQPFPDLVTFPYPDRGDPAHPTPFGYPSATIWDGWPNADPPPTDLTSPGIGDPPG